MENNQLNKKLQAIEKQMAPLEKKHKILNKRIDALQPKYAPGSPNIP